MTSDDDSRGSEDRKAVAPEPNTTGVTRGERHSLASLDGETGCTTFYVNPLATDLYRWRCDKLVSEQGLVARHHADAVQNCIAYSRDGIGDGAI